MHTEKVKYGKKTGMESCCKKFKKRIKNRDQNPWCLDDQEDDDHCDDHIWLVQPLKKYYSYTRRRQFSIPSWSCSSTTHYFQNVYDIVKQNDNNFISYLEKWKRKEKWWRVEEQEQVLAVNVVHLTNMWRLIWYYHNGRMLMGITWYLSICIHLCL